MRILCVSDVVHKYLYEPLAKEVLKPDLIVSCGDLPFEYLDYIVSHFNVPMFFVMGNHDDYDRCVLRSEKFLFFPSNSFKFSDHYNREKFFGGLNLDSNVVKFKNFTFMGLDGSLRYNDGKYQYTEAEMKFKILKMYPRLIWNKLFNSCYLDILVTHSPPFGIHDRKDPAHVGFKAFWGFIKFIKPKYLLHGHTHIYDLREKRISKVGDTTVINCYGYYLLEV